MSASIATRSLSTLRDKAQTDSTTSPVDFDYWLAHCEGYCVRSAGGRLGIVECVRLAQGTDHAESLVVLAGIFGRRRIFIDVGQVNAIVPHEQRVLLKPDATIVETDPRT